MREAAAWFSISATACTSMAKYLANSIITEKTRLMGIDTLTDAQCRVLASSVLCDVKYARDLGGYKEDSSLDGINYEALRVGEIRELLEKRPADCTPNNERLVEARK